MKIRVVSFLSLLSGITLLSHPAASMQKEDVTEFTRTVSPQATMNLTAERRKLEAFLDKQDYPAAFKSLRATLPPTCLDAEIVSFLMTSNKYPGWDQLSPDDQAYVLSKVKPITAENALLENAVGTEPLWNDAESQKYGYGNCRIEWVQEGNSPDERKIPTIGGIEKLTDAAKALHSFHTRQENYFKKQLRATYNFSDEDRDYYTSEERWEMFSTCSKLNDTLSHSRQALHQALATFIVDGTYEESNAARKELALSNHTAFLESYGAFQSVCAQIKAFCTKFSSIIEGAKPQTKDLINRVKAKWALSDEGYGSQDYSWRHTQHNARTTYAGVQHMTRQRMGVLSPAQPDFLEVIAEFQTEIDALPERGKAVWAAFVERETSQIR